GNDFLLGAGTKFEQKNGKWDIVADGTGSLIAILGKGHTITIGTPKQVNELPLPTGNGVEVHDTAVYQDTADGKRQIISGRVIIYRDEDTGRTMLGLKRGTVLVDQRLAKNGKVDFS